MTTEKMLPEGFMPGKDELLFYRDQYASDASFSLFTRIDSFDISLLNTESIEAFCKRYSSYTGVGDSGWWEPMRDRARLMAVSFMFEKSNFERAEQRFRDHPDEKSYKNLRAAFSAVIGQKVCLEYLKKKEAFMTEAQHAAEKARKEMKDKAWEEKRARRKKILAIAKEHPGFVSDMQFDEEYFIETYHLSDEDQKEIDEMVEEEEAERRKRDNIPYDHIEKYDYWDGYYSVPILAEKLRRIRKTLKMNQRDFAKLISFPNANKYMKYEQGKLDRLDKREKTELIKNVCDATCANPYWLEKELEETVYEADEDQTAKTVKEARSLYEYPMFAANSVIRQWWIQNQKWLKGIWD